MTEGTEELHKDRIVKAIKYVEKAETTCPPTAEITEGGIGQKFATIKVTSGRGCGLDAIITFIVARATGQEIRN